MTTNHDNNRVNTGIWEKTRNVIGLVLLIAVSYEMGVRHARFEKSTGEYTVLKAQYDRIEVQYPTLKAQYDRTEAQLRSESSTRPHRGTVLCSEG